MQKSAGRTKAASLLALTALALLAAALIGRSWAWVAATVFAVVAGIFFAQVRGTGRESTVRVAEMSAGELSRLQDAALARGLRSIAPDPVGPHLDQTHKHFAIVQSSRRDRTSQTEILRCIVVLYVSSEDSRIGELDIDAEEFAGLTKIDDPGQAEEIVRNHASAPIYSG
ncbi:hypothetical protein [Streptomyces sp. NPDC101776]|uniref:hypothetical protein n=1 Tax=Streptomyces sp. NPDC101776 TaxID=3366146 RepID=UPI00381A8EF7